LVNILYDGMYGRVGNLAASGAGPAGTATSHGIHLTSAGYLHLGDIFINQARLNLLRFTECNGGPLSHVGTIYAWGCWSAAAAVGLSAYKTNIAFDKLDCRGCGNAVAVVSGGRVHLNRLYFRHVVSSGTIAAVSTELFVGECDTDSIGITSGGLQYYCNKDGTTGKMLVDQQNLGQMTTQVGRGGTGLGYRIDPAKKSVPFKFALPPFWLAAGRTTVAITFYQCSVSAAGSNVPSVEVVLLQGAGLTLATGATVTVADVATAWNGSETQHTVTLTGTTLYAGLVQIGLLVKDNSDGDALFHVDDLAWSSVAA
jgi:hypothetical protein